MSLTMRFFEGLFALQSRKCANRGLARVASDQVSFSKQVDTKTLAVGSQTHCILGQVYGSYRAGLERHGLQDGPHAAAYGFRVEEGFLSRTLGNERSLAILTKVWQRLIIADGRLLQPTLKRA